MKNTKWVDIHVGENIFTVRCVRSEDSSFGMIVWFDVFEQHPHPTNFFKQLIEFQRCKHFTSGQWVENLADDSLQERIIDTCKNIVKSNEKHFDAIKEWENL